MSGEFMFSELTIWYWITNWQTLPWGRLIFLREKNETMNFKIIKEIYMGRF